MPLIPQADIGASQVGRLTSCGITAVRVAPFGGAKESLNRRTEIRQAPDSGEKCAISVRGLFKKPSDRSTEYELHLVINHVCNAPGDIQRGGCASQIP